MELTYNLQFTIEFRQLGLNDDRYVVEKYHLITYYSFDLENLKRTMRIDLFTFEDLGLKYEIAFDDGFIFTNIYGYHAYSDDVDDLPQISWENKLEFIDAILLHIDSVLNYKRR